MCLYRLDFLSVGTTSDFFSAICAKIQNHCVCHLVNNKVEKYIEYVENKGRTMPFYNCIALSLCAFEKIKLVKTRSESVFKIIKNIPKTQFICDGARDGP